MADNWNADASDNAGTNNGTELNSQGAVVAALPEAERVKREEQIAAFKAKMAERLERERKEKEEFAKQAKELGISLKDAKPAKAEKVEQVDVPSEMTATHWQGTATELSCRLFPTVRGEDEATAAYGSTKGFLKVMIAMGVGSIVGSRKAATGKGKRSEVFRLPTEIIFAVPLLESEKVASFQEAA